VRATDLLARLGGDEFLVALTGLDPVQAAKKAQAVAAELSASVTRPVRLAAGEVHVGASIGIATSPLDAVDFSRLFHLADLRMYELKHPVGPAAGGARPARTPSDGSVVPSGRGRAE
jgi:diguanylate cyclase (GGDEF)-like protein